MDINSKLISEFSLKPWQVENTVKLIDDGNTIPFIARYRKEATGSLDDQLLRRIEERLQYLRSLGEQKAKILAAIEEQGAATDEITAAIENAATLTELDDIYRPFRPKRKTRASVARAKGLQPLADAIYAQQPGVSPQELAKQYIGDDVPTIEDALGGACDIIAEAVSDDANGRRMLRYSVKNNGVLRVTAADDNPGVYEMYSDYSEAVKSVAPHRILAVNRGERQGALKAGIEFDRETGITILANLHIKNSSPCALCVKNAVEDAYSRLVYPSIERDIRNLLTDSANAQAIDVFAKNTRQLLMQPPVKNRVTMGLDPGYRTGCKVAVVDETGKVLDTGVIYAAPPHNKVDAAKRIIKDMIKKHGVKMIAIGNGTASHETEFFAADVIRDMDCKITYMVVSEAGASVYSASKLAAEEFPDYDVSLRSAVSIARRLQDPLAELVKIDPKAIGVGQYQHDMPQKQLGEALDGVVEDCVNSVGVDLNTASAPLLKRVAGVTSAVADNIVKFRCENGAFTSRAQLKKVPKLGPKAFEQCAGFLRVPESSQVLDSTAVHPESYNAARELLKLCGISEDDVRNSRVSKINEFINTRGLKDVSDRLGIGEPTLADIAAELSKPGRDPRNELPAPMLRSDVMSLEDLREGMEL